LSDTEQQLSEMMLRLVPGVTKINCKTSSHYLQSDGFMPDDGAKTDGEKNWSTYFNLPVMFFVHKMVSCSECYQVSIIRWCRYRNRSCTAHICVAELVSQQLKFICSKTVIIPQNMIVWRTAGTLRRREHEFTYLAFPHNKVRFLSSVRARLSSLNSYVNSSQRKFSPVSALNVFKGE